MIYDDEPANREMVTLARAEALTHGLRSALASSRYVREAQDAAALAYTRAADSAALAVLWDETRTMTYSGAPDIHAIGAAAEMAREMTRAAWHAALIAAEEAAAVREIWEH